MQPFFMRGQLSKKFWDTPAFFKKMGGGGAGRRAKNSMGAAARQWQNCDSQTGGRKAGRAESTLDFGG